MIFSFFSGKETVKRPPIKPPNPEPSAKLMANGQLT